jgi:hypothetical protein
LYLDSKQRNLRVARSSYHNFHLKDLKHSDQKLRFFDVPRNLYHNFQLKNYLTLDSKLREFMWLVIRIIIFI